ncbi:MAG TPA: hypothetical protein VHZ98_03860 [Galbitalea sp.]|jgi:outer membrane receptor for monomeric catechols|nr:hypothetical protein [Galbitalea sp.]
MAQQATQTRSDTIEYGHAPIPAAEADLPDFGIPEASPATRGRTEDHASFEAHDFGGTRDR